MSFVWAMGRDYTPTLAHHATAFRIGSGSFGLLLSGSAWPSLLAALKVAFAAAPLTAAIGLPIEITGGALNLATCFVFRDMAVGLQAGTAMLAQTDRSLDEASPTLGARSLATVRRVMRPPLRPGLTASLIYAFVRAMTAVSAVISLVSAEYDATGPGLALAGVARRPGSRVEY